MIMFGFAVSGHWPYAKKYGGAMAVGNFNFSILMRNEIFGRLLYLFVNTLFAKVRHRWGIYLGVIVDSSPVDAVMVAARLHIYLAGSHPIMIRYC